MKTKVKLEGMQFFAHHGYYKEEQKMGCQFILDAQVEVKSFDEFDDRIDDTVDYQKVYEICTEEMATTQQLIETVAFRIASRMKALKNVTGGEISIKKCQPKLGGIVESSVVEMEF